MEVKTLTPAQQNRTVRAATSKKKSSVKNVLVTPYNPVWPVLDKEVQCEIIEKLSRTLEPLGIKKQKADWMKGKVKKPTFLESLTEDQRKVRSCLVFGINEVTRCMEQGKLRCVLVDRDCQPSVITKHLITLSALRNCTAACIQGLSTTAGPVMGLKSLIALGFKKTEDSSISVFDEFLKFLEEKSPAVDVPWLQDSTVTEESEFSRQLCEEKSFSGKSHDMESHDPKIKQNSNMASEENDVKMKDVTEDCTGRVKEKPQVKRPEIATDYNHLYILKSESEVWKRIQEGIPVDENKSSKGDNKDQLESMDQSTRNAKRPLDADEPMNIQLTSKVKVLKTEKYIKTKIQQMVPNKNKVKKKKKPKNK